MNQYSTSTTNFKTSANHENIPLQSRKSKKKKSSPDHRMASVSPPPMNMMIDHTYITNLQSEITRMTNKYTNLNQRYTNMENKVKLTEEKNSKLIEENKLVKEDIDRKNKEIKNLNVKIEYLTKEKNDMDNKLREARKYISKLEQKLIDITKNKITPIMDPLREIKLAEQKANESPDEIMVGKSQKKQESPKRLLATNDMNRIQELEDTITNQAFEIKILTNALQQQTNEEDLPTIKEAISYKLKYQNLKEEYDRLSQLYEKALFEKKHLSSGGNVIVYDMNDGNNNLVKNSENENIPLQVKADNSLIDNEKKSLYDYIKKLNERIIHLSSENARLDSIIRELNSKHTIEVNALNLELENRNVQIKSLNEKIILEKTMADDLTQKLMIEANKTTELNIEVEKMHELDQSNTNLNSEIQRLNGIIKAMEDEICYYKESYNTLQKEKDKLRGALENIIKKNSDLEENVDPEKQVLTQRITTARENNLINQTTRLISDLENLGLERKKLKQSLNEAINEINAYKMKEKDIDKELKRKEKQIENLINSKTMVQANLGDQIFKLETKCERLNEEIKKLRNENEGLNGTMKRQTRKQ